jgi:hypothetical protein
MDLWKLERQKLGSRIDIAMMRSSVARRSWLNA